MSKDYCLALTDAIERELITGNVIADSLNAESKSKLHYVIAAISGFSHTELWSSSIQSFSYDSTRRTLYAIFINGGACYMYENVPRDVAEGLVESLSKGRFFHTAIRKTLQYKKLK